MIVKEKKGDISCSATDSSEHTLLNTVNNNITHGTKQDAQEHDTGHRKIHEGVVIIHWEDELIVLKLIPMKKISTIGIVWKSILHIGFLGKMTNA